MPPTKAGGKIDKRLEEDALFKEIGGQLDANFDYGQWQRTGKQQPQSSAPGKDVRVKRPAKAEKTSTAGFTVTSAPAPRAAKKVVESADRTCHRNSYQEKKLSVNAAFEEARARKKAEQIKVLQLRINARKQTIAEYRKRQAELLISNLEMRDSIIEQEKEAHEEVKKLLRKYEKYRGGINVLNERFVDDLAEARASFEQTKQKVNADIAVLQGQVDEMEARLKEKQDELHVLVNYKDKEYPVKALRISELHTEMDELKLAQEEEAGELNVLVDSEVNKFRKEESQRHSDITGKATEGAINRMHPSLKDMAMQNFVMIKELEFHRNEIEQIKEQNMSLSEQVKGLREDPKTDIRRQMFPEFFPTHDKCTPDMEVVLDIPTQKWLPI